MPIETEHAQIVARDWYAAWNSHDAERVLARCAPDVRYASPLIGALGMGRRERLAGRHGLRTFLERAFERFPDLYLRPRLLLVGVESITLHYRGLGGLLVAETLELTDRGRVRGAASHYAAMLEGAVALAPTRPRCQVGGVGERRPGWGRQANG